MLTNPANRFIETGYLKLDENKTNTLLTVSTVHFVGLGLYYQATVDLSWDTEQPYNQTVHISTTGKGGHFVTGLKQDT